MDLTKILSISGKPGLHQMIAQTKAGLVVESLNDGKRFTAFSHQRISSLEEISIYTYDEDLPLKDVFKMLYEKMEGKAVPDPKKSGSEIKVFFETIVKDYDQERVYVSDIKKILGWYNDLLERNLLSFEEEATEDSIQDATVVEETTAEGVEQKSASAEASADEENSASAEATQDEGNSASAEATADEEEKD